MSEIPKIARARLGGQQAAGAGSHPDADQMTAFLERSLGAREREQVLEHLARCAECREVAALALPPEEAERLAGAAPRVRWLEWPAWGGLRWAAVAATFVIAVSLIFQSYRETPLKYSSDTAQNRPVATTAPATAPAESAKQAAPARTDETQPSAAAPLAKEKAPSSSTVAVLRDQEAGRVGGPSKLDSVTRAKTGQKSGELAAGVGAGVAGGVPGDRMAASRMDDSKKSGSEGKVEVAGGTLAARAAAAPAMAAESRRGPAAPAPQQQVAGLAQQAPPPPPATAEELHRQAAAEPVSRAAADRAEAAKVTAQNEVVSVEASEKDAQPRAGAGNAAPAGGFAASRKMTSSAAVSLRWAITAEGRVQRSADQGQTWKSTALDPRLRFRAVSANGAEVWAGGEGGALYHSSDSGNHWTRVALPAELASATIVRVEFTDAHHGTLSTSAGESWATSDGGASWQKK